MKIMTIVGARPNYMKAAPIIMAIRKHNKKTAQANAELAGEVAVPVIDHILVHTGQHYDALMSDSFFADRVRAGRLGGRVPQVVCNRARCTACPVGCSGPKWEVPGLAQI